MSTVDNHALEITGYVVVSMMLIILLAIAVRVTWKALRWRFFSPDTHPHLFPELYIRRHTELEELPVVYQHKYIPRLFLYDGETYTEEGLLSLLAKTERDWTVAPGEYLQEMIEDGDLSRDDIAEVLTFTEDEVEDLLNGRRTVDETLAIELEHLSPIPAGTWLQYQRDYEADCQRLGFTIGEHWH